MLRAATDVCVDRALTSIGILEEKLEVLALGSKYDQGPSFKVAFKANTQREKNEQGDRDFKLVEENSNKRKLITPPRIEKVNSSSLKGEKEESDYSDDQEFSIELSEHELDQEVGSDEHKAQENRSSDHVEYLQTLFNGLAEQLEVLKGKVKSQDETINSLKSQVKSLEATNAKQVLIFKDLKEKVKTQFRSRQAAFVDLKLGVESDKGRLDDKLANIEDKVREVGGRIPPIIKQHADLEKKFSDILFSKVLSKGKGDNSNNANNSASGTALESRVTAVEMKVDRLDKESKVLEDVVRDAQGNAEIIRNTETKVKLIEVLMANKNEAGAVGAPPGSVRLEARVSTLEVLTKDNERAIRDSTEQLRVTAEVMEKLEKQKSRATVQSKPSFAATASKGLTGGDQGNYAQKSSQQAPRSKTKTKAPVKKPTVEEVKSIIDRVSLQPNYDNIPHNNSHRHNNKIIPQTTLEEDHVLISIAFVINGAKDLDRNTKVQVVRGYQEKIGILELVSRSSQFDNKMELFVAKSNEGEVRRLLQAAGCRPISNEERLQQAMIKFDSLESATKSVVVARISTRLGYLLANCTNIYIRLAILELNLDPEGVIKRASLVKEKNIRGTRGQHLSDELCRLFLERGVALSA